MSVSGVSASNTLSQAWQNWQAQAQKVQSEFQQLGRDLQAGNLSQAQSDFSVLSQNVASRLQSNNSLSQALSSLRLAHHAHNHAGVGSQGSTSSTQSTMLQQFSSLGSALQAGNLAAAQAAYATIQQDLEQIGWSAGTASASTSSPVSILA